MTAELLVNVTPSETRVAYIDGGILQEIPIEREARRGIVGNIYKGRVSRVLPGMQAAFVDIGLDKAAFLHASDNMPHTECVAGEEQKQFTVRDISELVRQGQDLMVQVVKDREARRGIVGNIYKGRVSRVLPGMQAAFVDIGLDKAAFLHASDNMPHTECVAGEEQKQFTVRDISELVRQGQDLMVQVVKDPLGTKGARLTTDITLPSRYLVFMPGASHVGVSLGLPARVDELAGALPRTPADFRSL